MSNKDIIETEEFVHYEHNEWLSQLNFYQDEIKFFQKELVKVINEHNHEFSSLESVEEYRKILLRKTEHIDELKDAIQQHERALAFPPEMDEDELLAHQQIRTRYHDFVKGFDAMKKNFKRYAAYND